MVDGSVVFTFKPPSRPPRASSKAATAHCIIVSFCHMMAMLGAALDRHLLALLPEGLLDRLVPSLPQVGGGLLRRRRSFLEASRVVLQFSSPQGCR